MKPVIMDVDTGIDDALAIAYAARSPELELIALTTCFGNISAQEATRNSLYVLEKLGKSIPVYEGAELPVSGSLKKPTPGIFTGRTGSAIRSGKSPKAIKPSWQRPTISFGR